ncbi:MAG: hypothetical protein WBF06_10640 [Candidatus Acidiferrales bacterium]
MKRSGLIAVFLAVIAAAVAFESGVAPASARQTTTTHRATTTGAPKATTAVAAAARASACCTVTAINASTGIVTARVTATGQTFTFAASGSVLNSLRVGQGVYANLTAKQVSLDGKTSCCAILSTAVAAQAATSALSGAAPASTGPCCSITAVNAQSNLITGESATGIYFVFSLTSIMAIPPGVSVGRKVYANFSTKAVSLDGSLAAGTIKYLCTVPANQNQPCPVGAATCEMQPETAGVGCPPVMVQTSTPASCKTGYHGPTCALSAACPPGNGVSSGGIGGTAICTCNEGFAGASCQYSNASTCSGHGTANDSGTCTCNAGYSGANCAAQN